MPGRADTEPPQPLEMAALQSLIDVAPDEPTGMASVDIEVAASFRNWQRISARKLDAQDFGARAGSRRGVGWRGFRA